MANLYFATEKASKDEARKTLTEHVKADCDRDWETKSQ